MISESACRGPYMPEKEKGVTGALQEVGAVGLNVMSIAHARIVVHHHMQLVAHSCNLYSSQCFFKEFAPCGCQTCPGNRIQLANSIPIQPQLTPNNSS